MEINFLQTVPDSQWFTNLEQILQYVIIENKDRYLEIGIRNSIAKGYKMIKDESVGE